MRKAPDAFRTISETAELLDTPAHVLRFWESKFSQLKPVKRAGGRRYYRRSDIDLLAGIKLLLHDQGMTIRGVQKLLHEKGRQHVADLAPISTSELIEIEDLAPAEAAEDQPAPQTGLSDDTSLSLVTPPLDVSKGAAPPTDQATGDTDIQPLPQPSAAPRSQQDTAFSRPKPEASPPAEALSPAPDPTAATQKPPVDIRLAHLIRARAPQPVDRDALAGLTERLSQLLSRMAVAAAQDTRD